MDWDTTICYWVKDVPYFWINGDTWSDCGRSYITGDNLSEICPHLPRFFQVSIFKDPTFVNFYADNVRINGKPIYNYNLRDKPLYTKPRDMKKYFLEYIRWRYPDTVYQPEKIVKKDLIMNVPKYKITLLYVDKEFILVNWKRKEIEFYFPDNQLDSTEKLKLKEKIYYGCLDKIYSDRWTFSYLGTSGCNEKLTDRAIFRRIESAINVR